MKNRAYLEKLVERYSDELFAYLCRYVGDRSLAEDILSDVFVKLIQQRKGLGDDGYNWRAWLYRVATNRAISGFRRQRLRSLISLEQVRLQDSRISPELHAEKRQEGERLKGAIGKLNNKLRSVVIMYSYQELSYKEIADALKINIGTVKSRLNEAKRQLKIALEVSHG